MRDEAIFCRALQQRHVKRMLAAAGVVFGAHVGSSLQPHCSCTHQRALTNNAQHVSAGIEVVQPLHGRKVNQRAHNARHDRQAALWLTCTASDGADAPPPATKALREIITSAAGAPSTCRLHMRGCSPTAAGSRGIAATSVLAASRQEQGATSVSDTPPNTDDIPSPRSPAMMSSQCWSSARSYTSKKTAAKVLTNLPPRMTTARAVKLAGGMPLKPTETAPVETSCGNTTCSEEQRERRG